MPLSLSHYSLTVHSLEFTDINLEMTFLFTSICYPQRCFLGSVVDPGSPSLCGSLQTRTQPLFIGSASAPSFWNWSGSICDSRLQTVVILMSLASNAYLIRTVKGRNWECMTPAPAKKKTRLCNSGFDMTIKKEEKWGVLREIFTRFTFAVLYLIHPSVLVMLDFLLFLRTKKYILIRE